MTATLALVWEHARFATRGALVALALTACGQAADGAANSTASDTASAYQALSASVQSCQDDKAACVTAAAGDATQTAACETAAASCMDKTQSAQADARKHLRADAEGCVRHCRRHAGADADGGVGEADGGMSTRDCMQRRAPAGASQCMDAFFSCLDATGVRQSGAGTELDTATRDAIGACVDTAHSCMMNQMMSRRREHAPRHARGTAGTGMDAAAGRPAPTFPREPRAEAGADADTDGRPFGRRGAQGTAGSAPMHHQHRFLGVAGAAGGN